jgi:hypothetical protein
VRPSHLSNANGCVYVCADKVWAKPYQRPDTNGPTCLGWSIHGINLGLVMRNTKKSKQIHSVFEMDRIADFITLRLKPKKSKQIHSVFEMDRTAQCSPFRRLAKDTWGAFGSLQTAFLHGLGRVLGRLIACRSLRSCRNRVLKHSRDRP